MKKKGRTLRPTHRTRSLRLPIRKRSDGKGFGRMGRCMHTNDHGKVITGRAIRGTGERGPRRRKMVSPITVWTAWSRYNTYTYTNHGAVSPRKSSNDPARATFPRQTHTPAPAPFEEPIERTAAERCRRYIKHRIPTFYRYPDRGKRDQPRTKAVPEILCQFEANQGYHQDEEGPKHHTHYSRTQEGDTKDLKACTS